MNIRAYIFGVTAAFFVLAVVIVLLRRRRLRERHAVLWLIAGVGALLLGAFPQSLEAIADFIGIELPINLVFFVSIALLFLVSIQHSAELTQREARERDLAEKVVLLQLRVEELEARDVSSKHDRGALPGDEPGPER